MTDKGKVWYGWFVLVYKLLAEPNRLRASVWRKLGAAGAAYLQNGVAALPADAAGERAMWGAAQEVREFGGTAHLLRGEAVGHEAALIGAFGEARDAEYAEVLSKCRDFHAELEKERAAGKFTFAVLEKNEEELAKLEAWLRKVELRDRFGALFAAEARAVLYPLRVRPSRGFLVLMAACPLTVGVGLVGGATSRLAGAALLAAFALAIAYLVVASRHHPFLESEEVRGAEEKRRSYKEAAGLTVLGLAVIAVGGEMVTVGAEGIVSALGLSALLVGMVITPAAIEVEEVIRQVVPAGGLGRQPGRHPPVLLVVQPGPDLAARAREDRLAGARLRLALPGRPHLAGDPLLRPGPRRSDQFLYGSRA